MSDKSTTAEVTKRVNAVYDLLINGAERRHILQFAAKEGWNLENRQIDNYIHDATELIKVEANHHRTAAFDKQLSGMARLCMKAVGKKDEYLELAVRREQSKLLGLNAPEKSEIEMNMANIVDLTAEAMTSPEDDATPEETETDDGGEDDAPAASEVSGAGEA